MGVHMSVDLNIENPINLTQQMNARSISQKFRFVLSGSNRS